MGDDDLFISTFAQGAPGKVESFVLKNGIRVLTIYFEGSRHVSVFSFLPGGLTCDGSGQTQWSHLVEHLAIRSTVPFGSPRANGETMADHIRLDYYGNVDNWREGLSHQARWIGGTKFSAATLRAEKDHVKAECETVVRRLATHKFALAAWAQGYRHGRPHAAVIGDINQVSLVEIQQYRNRTMGELTEVLLCVVGGVDGKTVRAAVTESMSSLTGGGEPVKKVPLQAGRRRMSWDLKGRHLLMAWPVCETADRDYAALLVTGQELMRRLYTDEVLKQETGMVLAGVDLRTPEGNFFYVSASLKETGSFKSVEQHIERHINDLRERPETLGYNSLLAQELGRQLTVLADPALLKGRAPAQITEAMLEGNVGLQWAVADYRYGKQRAALGRRLGRVNGGEVQRVCRVYLSQENGSTVSLTPPE